jgi:hypothetical protein
MGTHQHFLYILRLEHFQGVETQESVFGRSLEEGEWREISIFQKYASFTLKGTSARPVCLAIITLSNKTQHPLVLVDPHPL